MNSLLLLSLCYIFEREKNQLVYGSHADFKNASLTKQLGFLVFHNQNTLVHDSMRVYHTFCEQDVALYHRDASVGVYGVTDIILFQLKHKFCLFYGQ